MKFLRVINWGEYQHYKKDRTPPWIKLHSSLLDDFTFHALTDVQKAHLMLIWLLASKTKNKITADAEWIKSRIGVAEDVNIKVLVKAAFLEEFEALADCKQDDSNTLPSRAPARSASVSVSVSDSASTSSLAKPKIGEPELQALVKKYHEQVFTLNPWCTDDTRYGQAAKNIRHHIEGGEYTLEQLRLAADRYRQELNVSGSKPKKCGNFFGQRPLGLFAAFLADDWQPPEPKSGKTQEEPKPVWPERPVRKRK